MQKYRLLQLINRWSCTWVFIWQHHLQSSLKTNLLILHRGSKTTTFIKPVTRQISNLPTKTQNHCFIKFQKQIPSSHLYFHLKYVVELLAQSCPTLCNPMNCSPPGSSVHGILQATIQEWVAIHFSKVNMLLR